MVFTIQSIQGTDAANFAFKCHFKINGFWETMEFSILTDKKYLN